MSSPDTHGAFEGSNAEVVGTLVDNHRRFCGRAWLGRGGCRHDEIPPAGGWGEDAVVGEQVRVRAGNECGEAFDEGERVEGYGAGAIAPWMSQAIDDAAVLAERQALGGDRWASDVAREALEPGAVAGGDHGPGMQGEAVDLRAELARGEIGACVAALADVLVGSPL